MNSELIQCRKLDLFEADYCIYSAMKGLDQTLRLTGQKEKESIFIEAMVSFGVSLNDTKALKLVNLFLYLYYIYIIYIRGNIANFISNCLMD